MMFPIHVYVAFMNACLLVCNLSCVLTVIQADQDGDVSELECMLKALQKQLVTPDA